MLKINVLDINKVSEAKKELYLHVQGQNIAWMSKIS